MNKRPAFITFLAAVFAIIAISFPIQISLLYGYGFDELTQLLNKISSLNILTATALTCNVYLLWQASPALKITLPLTIAITAWNNIVVGSYSHDYTMMTTSLASSGFLIICTPLFFNKKMRTLLNNPQLRWWLRPKRVSADLFTQVNPYVGDGLLAKSYDLSESGIFITYESCVHKDGHKDLIQTNLNVGDYTSLVIRLSQFNVVKCEAEVVRTSQDAGNYPAGIGLKFINLDANVRGHLKNYVDLQ